MATKLKVNYEFVGDSTTPVTRTNSIKHGDKMLDTVINNLENYVTPQMFGAKGDGVTDDTTAIQNAINHAGNGGVVYLPKGNYYITNTINIPFYDFTIYSSPKSEYTTQISTDKNITMIKVSTYGVKISDLMFFRTNLTDTVSTNGIFIDRGGDEEYLSNLDAEIVNCSFIYLHTAIQGRGRNVNVKNSSFTQCQICIKGICYTYSLNGGTAYAQFRGWKIIGNAFHCTESRTTKAATPKTIADSNVWCIDFPMQNSYESVSCCVIKDNAEEYATGGFYKGSLCGMVIENNVMESVCGAFIYSVESSQYLGGTVVSGNRYTRGYSMNYPDFPSTDVDILSYIIYIKNLTEIDISNNSLGNSFDTSIYLENVSNCKIVNNMITAFKYYGINCINPYKIRISENTFNSRSSEICKCVKTASGYISLMNNTNLSSHENTDLYDVPATSIIRTDNSLGWIIPEMCENWSYISAGTSGYRKLVNGKTEIQVTLTGGTDNSCAFYLPNGYKPLYNLYIPSVSIWSGTTEAYAFISADTGGVFVNAVGEEMPLECCINVIFDS